MSEKFLMPFPKVVGEGGWFTGVTLPSKQAINHDGIDSRLAVAGSPSLHHHAGIIKRIRDVQDVETPRKDSSVQPAHPFLYPSDRGLLSLAMELAHDTARARSKLKRYHHAVSK
ncbi:hypothetical protein LNO55_01740 [Klebsiella pneumoniae subsp. pneumoniae]|nr:hypothetical protein [Klebsiella pneumoniae subsp. pneumoniae]